MGLSPSEKTKLLREVRELFDKNDEVDQRQSENIKDLLKRMDAFDKRLKDLEKAIAKKAG